MNYRGSYRRLLANARSAMLGSIEIYNKPRFDYRDEVVVILLLNAWELLLKAIVSKTNKSIFYPKKRKEPYRTLSWHDALRRAGATTLWPGLVPYQAVERNLELLSVYRDNAVHFYNAPGFGVLIYALLQTGILNFRDLMREVFDRDLGTDITWHLLPLGLHTPVDPISYLRGAWPSGLRRNAAVEQFLKALLDATSELEQAGIDTGRLLTVFNVTLQSTKKIQRADIVMGVGAAASADPVIVTRKMDPNVTHPLRQKDVLEQVGVLHGVRFTSRSFQAVIWRHGLRGRERLCWMAQEGGLVKWSQEVVTFIRGLTAVQLEEAKAAYSAHLRGI
jgi:EC042_2821-lke REase/Protein of unknown function (DUF3644)